MPQLTKVDVRDVSGYIKGEREGKKGEEDDDEMVDGMVEQELCWKK